MSEHRATAWSGRAADDLTVAGVVGGELGPDDIRISPDTLRHQADVARAQALALRVLADRLRARRARAQPPAARLRAASGGVSRP